MNPVVEQRWKALNDSEVAISAICEAEILFGLRKKGSDRLRDLFETVLKGRFQVLPIDSDVAAAYADLRGDCEEAGVTVQDMDLLIAATAKTHGLVVATLNTKHFSKIPGLAYEDWSQPSES